MIHVRCRRDLRLLQHRRGDRRYRVGMILQPRPRAVGPTRGLPRGVRRSCPRLDRRHGRPRAQSHPVAPALLWAPGGGYATLTGDLVLHRPRLGTAARHAQNQTGRQAVCNFQSPTTGWPHPFDRQLRQDHTSPLGSHGGAVFSSLAPLRPFTGFYPTAEAMLRSQKSRLYVSLPGDPDAERLAKVGVEGSNPFARSKIMKL